MKALNLKQIKLKQQSENLPLEMRFYILLNTNPSLYHLNRECSSWTKGAVSTAGRRQPWGTRDRGGGGSTRGLQKLPLTAASPVPSPGWRSRTRGMLPTAPFPSSRAVQPPLTPARISSEPSQFLLPDRCRRLNTGHIPAKSQGLKEVMRKR